MSDDIQDVVVAAARGVLGSKLGAASSRSDWTSFELDDAAQGAAMLKALIGAVAPGVTDFLPEQLLASAQLRITELHIRVDGEIRVSFEFSGAEWAPFRDWLVVREADATLEIARSGEDGAVTVACTVHAALSFHEVAVEAALSWPDLHVSLGASPNASPVSLAPLLGALGLHETGLDRLALRSFTALARLRTPALDVRTVLDGVLEFQVGNLRVEAREIDLRLLYVGGEHGGAAGEFQATVAIGPADQSRTPITFVARAQFDGGWKFEGAVRDLSVDAVFAALGATPPAVDGLEVAELSLTFETDTKSVAVHLEGALDLGTATKPRIAIDAALAQQADGSRTADFRGELRVGVGADERVFDLRFDSGGGRATTMIATFRAGGSDELSLADFAQVFGGDVDALHAFDFKLRGALLVLQRSDKWRFLFAADMDFGLDLSGLSSLPLVGAALPVDQALKISFEPVVATITGDMADIKSRLPAGSPELPDSIAQEGVWLQAALSIGGQSRNLSLDLDTNSIDGPSQLGTTAPPKPAVDPAASLAKGGAIRWVDLQKRFGPVHLARIGLGLVKPATGGQALAVVLDGSLTAGPLEITLDGLGAEYDLQTKQLSFRLDGLALEFSRDPIHISGAFLRLDGGEFAGKVLFRAKTFTLSALGAYGEVQGHPSLFIYGFLDYPIGGPSFFFVEGLALGFGLNRRLLLPPIERLHEFPLVAEALGTIPAPRIPDNASREELANAIRTELTSLVTYVPPELGQYLLVVGVKFSSFKLIDSFALISVGFGQRLDVAVMGVSTLVVPSSAAGESIPPIAVVRMAFSAQYDAESGALIARAQLTPDSYLFSRACRLQGGFAFASWLKGEHAGDFVATLGGYHPSYRPPAHYPQDVPRLGFQWRVNDEVFIKGSAYYALTPSAVMAGGRLEASYNSGSIQASFVAGADFLMSWKPFHYDARVYVEVAASVVVEFFGTHHLSISAGADLHVWGPEFAGTADVYVKVIGIPIEFAVEFGASSQGAPPKIDWSNFAGSFFPANPESSVCSLVATGGLQRTLGSGVDERWIVNAKELSITIDSLVPATRRLRVAPDLAANHSTELAGGADPVQLGIEPMGVTAAALESTYVVQITLDGDDASDEFAFVPRTKRFPRALWNPAASPTSSVGVGGADSIEALAGYELQPAKPPAPGATSLLRHGDLAYETDDATRSLNWVGKGKFTGAVSTTSGEPLDEVRRLLTDAGAARERERLLRALGFDPARDVDLGPDLTESWIESPCLASLAFSDSEPMSA